ncbi:MAG: hypothetical protein GWN67_04875, partial [Phycisphaerae bacterium]|nr:hypothetical protein [Phycisphaerae bacterium]
MNNNGVNFGISGNAQAYFQHSIDTSNLVNGKPVYYLIGQENMIITPSTYPQIGFLALVDCVNIRVENLVLTDICNLQGILLASTNNSTLANNLVENNQEGIALYLSSDNTISNNIATNSYVGVKLDSSSDNTVVGNTLKDNNLGIELSTTASFSTNNTIFDNNIKTSDVGISLNSGGNDVIHNTLANITSTGIAVGSDSSENDISNNTVRSEAYGIYLGGLPAKRPISNTISGNDIAINGATSARAGITLGYSDRNTISQNTIVFLKSTYTTSQGIRIVSSLDNIIFNNTVANSGWRGAGISLQAESSGNVIFHNDFVDNPTQAYSSEDSISSWDNGYPSGGNYWSDYIGIDEKSGSKQDQTGSDGIGDTPYVIDERNRDRYPLMHPSSFTPWVLVTSPNGGEKWLVGSFQCICWADLGVSSNVSIDLSIDSGTTWEETLFANTVANGIKSWRVI